MAAIPLIRHHDPAGAFAWRGGQPVSVARFLGDVARLAECLPDKRHILNLCADRYRFAVGFAAANPTVFAVGGTIQTNELLGFAVGNNDPLGLIPGIDQALAAMRADGKYDEILNKWF